MQDLLDAARKAFEEAIKLATDGPRRVLLPALDPNHEGHKDGYLLPTAVSEKIGEAGEILRNIAKRRHNIGRD